MNKEMFAKKSFMKLMCLISLSIMIVNPMQNVLQVHAGSTQPFVLNNESEEVLNLEDESFYNGSISITVSVGVGVNATLNGETKEVLLGETKDFIINNTKKVIFILSSYGYVEGSFEIELTLISDPNSSPARKAIGIVAALLLALSVITYYIRAKRMEPKDEDEEEEQDPEVAKRRKEAAGAEKRYLGLDDI